MSAPEPTPAIASPSGARRAADLSAVLTVAAAVLATPIFLRAASDWPGGALGFLFTFWAALILLTRRLSRRLPAAEDDPRDSG